MAWCSPQLAPETELELCFLGRSSQLLGRILSNEHLLLMCGSTYKLNIYGFSIRHSVLTISIDFPT